MQLRVYSVEEDLPRALDASASPADGILQTGRDWTVLRDEINAKSPLGPIFPPDMTLRQYAKAADARRGCPAPNGRSAAREPGADLEKLERLYLADFESRLEELPLHSVRCQRSSGAAFEQFGRFLLGVPEGGLAGPQVQL